MRSRLPMILSATLAGMAGLLLIAHRARAEDPAPKRIPWTTSRIAGTPEPPPPLTVEAAFPKLTFDRPLLLEPVPGTRRLLIGELAGKVVTFPEDRDADHADLALDLAKQPDGCAALYGLAFHPNFEQNRLVYLCYVIQNGYNKPEGTRVSRFKAHRDDPLTILPESEEIIITFPGGGHNGGCLQFGKDGYLYISTGDGSGPTPPDPLGTGQDLADLLSSILRIDVDHTDPGLAYRVPPDNPFVNLPGARPEIWAFGFRNPWRMSIDPDSGTLWVGDVGWELWELIFRVERGGNYGWSVVEGPQPVHPEGVRGPTPITPPVVSHPHSEAASITGGYVYHGDRLKDLQDVYIYGDYQSGTVWGLRYDPKTNRVTRHDVLAETGLRLASFGLGAGGELYLVEHERSNRIYRLVPNPAPKSGRPFPQRLSQTGLFASTRDHRPAPGVIPYAINAESWSDGAQAERLLAIPGDGRIEHDEQGRWHLPEGSVLARTVSLELIAGDPTSRQRVETQLLHIEDGSWRPYTYVWDDDQADAVLADPKGTTRCFAIRDPDAPGGQRSQEYRIAARSECILCHNPWVEARTTVFGRQTASPLGLTTAQFNRDNPAGTTNQVRELERLGYFTTPLPEADWPRLADPYDATADLDARARAYFQVNCAHCHQFNAGGTATILLSANLPLDQTKTIGERPSQGTFGIDDAQIIAPGEPERSVLYYRIAKTGPGRMPRVGSDRVDTQATRLIGDWIASLPRSEPAPDDLNPALKIVRNPSASPKSCSESIDQLFATTRGALALSRAMERGELPEPTRQAVIASARDLTTVEVRDLFERFLPESERVHRLGDQIDAEALVALPGDSERGRRWFFAESATSCATCHRVEGQGGEVGPDLSAIGSKYGKRDLLRHILEPSREIDPKFAARTVATADGQLIVGLLISRDDRTLVLRDAKAQTIRLRPGQIEQEATSPTSLMPEGLLRGLTAQQAADLLEFLASRRDPAAPPPP